MEAHHGRKLGELALTCGNRLEQKNTAKNDHQD